MAVNFKVVWSFGLWSNYWVKRVPVELKNCQSYGWEHKCCCWFSWLTSYCVLLFSFDTQWYFWASHLKFMEHTGLNAGVHYVWTISLGSFIFVLCPIILTSFSWRCIPSVSKWICHVDSLCSFFLYNTCQSLLVATPVSRNVDGHHSDARGS